MRVLDTETLQLMHVFEDITGAQVRDCIIDRENNLLVFLVFPGNIGLAIGKGGTNIKIAEKMLKRNIKVYEYSEDPVRFIKNLIPQARRIEIKDKKVVVYVPPKDRGRVVGKEGRNIKIIRELVRRNCNGIEEVEIR